MCPVLTSSSTSILQIEVDGVAGLLSSYASCLQVVKLYGPTNFEPVIRHTMMMAKECRKRAYHILLILTDGDITDKQKVCVCVCVSVSVREHERG